MSERMTVSPPVSSRSLSRYGAIFQSRPMPHTFGGLLGVASKKAITLGTSPDDDQLKGKRRLAIASVSPANSRAYEAVMERAAQYIVRRLSTASQNANGGPIDSFSISFDGAAVLNLTVICGASVAEASFLLKDSPFPTKRLGQIRNIHGHPRDFLPFLRILPTAAHSKKPSLSLDTEAAGPPRSSTNAGGHSKTGPRSPARVANSMVSSGLDSHMPNTLLWGLGLLASRKDIQAKAYDSRDNYLLAFVKEIRRYFNTFGLALARETIGKDAVWNGHFIPEGTMVYCNTHAMNRDPTRFSSPDEFKPERYMSGPEAAAPFFSQPHRAAEAELATNAVATLAQRQTQMPTPVGEFWREYVRTTPLGGPGQGGTGAGVVTSQVAVQSADSDRRQFPAEPAQRDMHPKTKTTVHGDPEDLRSYEAAVLKGTAGEVPEEWRCWVCVPRPVDREKAVRLQKGVGGAGSEESQALGRGGNTARPAQPPSTMGPTPHMPPIAKAAPPSSRTTRRSLSYVHIAHDIVPSRETCDKLTRHAQSWRGITALTPFLPPTLPPCPPSPPPTKPLLRRPFPDICGAHYRLCALGLDDRSIYEHHNVLRSYLSDPLNVFGCEDRQWGDALRAQRVPAERGLASCLVSPARRRGGRGREIEAAAAAAREHERRDGETLAFAVFALRDPKANEGYQGG
ncbi:hypothetical protein LshimejAT787_0200060 [Lyophyllum shimeji]|uniref:Uncharacterized protein n=1 Tax=Lyophyllum shimeji TaxID=47721 RepID=A0A9P3PFC2_LYOSH|nr:hypothetical protein LshimejAT787_0200060 [Lyophyllum shimeji]